MKILLIVLFLTGCTKPNEMQSNINTAQSLISYVQTYKPLRHFSEVSMVLTLLTELNNSRTVFYSETIEETMRRQLLDNAEDDKLSVREYQEQLTQLEKGLAELKLKEYLRRISTPIDASDAARQEMYRNARTVKSVATYGPEMWCD